MHLLSSSLVLQLLLGSCAFCTWPRHYFAISTFLHVARDAVELGDTPLADLQMCDHALLFYGDGWIGVIFVLPEQSGHTHWESGVL